jgi:hypothetical protein
MGHFSMEIGAPTGSNLSGNQHAFHWMPVRKTYTMPSNTSRGSSGLRPPPAFLAYFFLRLRRLRPGTNGATIAQRSSETSHDCTRFLVSGMILSNHAISNENGKYIIYG